MMKFSLLKAMITLKQTMKHPQRIMISSLDKDQQLLKRALEAEQPTKSGTTVRWSVVSEGALMNLTFQSYGNKRGRAQVEMNNAAGSKPAGLITSQKYSRIPLFPISPNGTIITVINLNNSKYFIRQSPISFFLP